MGCKKCLVAANKIDQQNKCLKGNKFINERLYILLIHNYYRKILFPYFINSKFLIQYVLGFFMFCSHKRKKKLRFLFNHNCRKPR